MYKIISAVIEPPISLVSEMVSDRHTIIHNGELPTSLYEAVTAILSGYNRAMKNKVSTFYAVVNEGKWSIWISISGNESRKLKEFDEKKLADMNVSLKMIPAKVTVEDIVPCNDRITTTDQLRMLAFFLLVTRGGEMNGVCPELSSLAQYTEVLHTLFDSPIFKQTYEHCEALKHGKITFSVSEDNEPEGYGFKGEQKLPTSVFRGKEFAKNAEGQLRATLAVDWDAPKPPTRNVENREEKTDISIDKWLFIMKCLNPDFQFLDCFDLLIEEASAKGNVEFVDFLNIGRKTCEQFYLIGITGLRENYPDFEAARQALNALIVALPSTSSEGLALSVRRFRQCGEDNLISFLTTADGRKVCAKPGEHYIFSIFPDDATATGIKIEPPCDKCKMLFSWRIKTILDTK